MTALAFPVGDFLRILGKGRMEVVIRVCWSVNRTMKLKNKTKYVYLVYQYYEYVSSNTLSELAIIIQCLPQKLKCVHASYEELESMLQLNYDINSIFDSYKDTIQHSKSMKPSEATCLINFN